MRWIPWRRAGQPTPVFLPGESHGQRSLVGYNSQGRKESDRTEATQHTHMHSYTYTQTPTAYNRFHCLKNAGIGPEFYLGSFGLKEQRTYSRYLKKNRIFIGTHNTLALKRANSQGIKCALGLYQNVGVYRFPFLGKWHSYKCDLIIVLTLPHKSTLCRVYQL